MAKSYARQFYKSKEWEKARAAALIRDRGMCQTPGCYRPAEEVHHIVHLTPENITDGAITLALDNLISLCRDCHLRQHDAERIKASHKSDILPDFTFVAGRPHPPVQKSDL